MMDKLKEIKDLQEKNFSILSAEDLDAVIYSRLSRSDLFEDAMGVIEEDNKLED